jgi:hypothetical protein
VSQQTREREKGVRPLWLNWAALWAAVAVAQLGRPKRGVRAGLREIRAKECKQADQWMGQQAEQAKTRRGRKVKKFLFFPK